jgi:hypothetical protein
MKKVTTKSYALRIDGPLVKPLQELKKQNRRSLNAEINAALEAWVAGAQQQPAAPAAAAPEVAAPKQARAKKQAKRKTAESDGASHTDTNAKADSSPETAAAADA